MVRQNLAQSVESLKMLGSRQVLSFENEVTPSSEPPLEQKKQEFDALLKQNPDSQPITMDDVNKMAVENILNTIRGQRIAFESSMRETSDAYKDE